MTDNRQDKIVGNSQNIGPNNSSRLFLRDKELVYVYKKIEKIISAIYLITNLFIADEPLKWNLREIGLKLITLFSDHNIPISRDNLKTGIYSQLESVLSLLNISFFAGLISEMNYEILLKEINSLLDQIKGAQFKEDIFVLKKEDFHIEDSYRTYIRQSPIESNMSDINLKDINIRQNKGQNYEPKVNSKHSKDFSDEKKDIRRNSIINMLKGGKVLTIKDFSTVIKEYSEKTIQRELLALVELGFIKKEGERRWSKYSLK